MSAMRTALAVRDADGNDKTYEATEKDVDMGLCEDLLKAFRADLMAGGYEDEAKAEKELALAIVSNMTGFYPMAARLFDGLTEDEWRTASPKQAVGVMRDVLAYALDMLGSIMGDDRPSRKRKNRRGPRRTCIRRCST